MSEIKCPREFTPCQRIEEANKILALLNNSRPIGLSGQTEILSIELCKIILYNTE
jgi:hypothetical protein